VVDVEKLKSEGKIDPDQTIIPNRIIDTNIQRSLPTYVGYLNSPRIAKFSDRKTPGAAGEKILEREFSTAFKYNGWQLPFISAIDGAHAYGWDFIEVVFDASKDSHVAFQHIGVDKLLFTRGIRDIQASPIVMRCIMLAKMQLDNFVKKHSWSADAVKQLTTDNRDNSQVDGLDNQNQLNVYKVYKCFFKQNGIVYVGWFSDKCEEWLQTPVKLYIGVDEFNADTSEYTPREEIHYPIVPIFYVRGEEEDIDKHRGRAFYDLPTQDAVMALVSNLINGTNRASNIYGSPASSMQRGDGVPKKLGVKLEPGCIYDNPIAFWSPPYPDGVIVNSIQMLMAQNQQQAGQVDFAAQNRKDSRKTAAEIQAAESNAAQLSSVQTLLFSLFFTNVIQIAWEIISSRAQQNLITFAHDEKVDSNNIELIQREYVITAAGGTDVLQRNNTLNMMRQDMQMMISTSVSQDFLATYLRLAYPEIGETLAIKLEQTGSRDQALVKSYRAMLEALLSDPNIAQNIPDDIKGQIASALQQGDIQQKPPVGV